MRKQGFTLIELMVVMAIISVLAAMLLPAIGDYMDRAKATKMVNTSSTMRSSCDAHYMDTGYYAREYQAPRYRGTSYHRLAFDVGSSGWNGPYIKSPLHSSDNPFHRDVYLYAETANGRNDNPGQQGFDLDCDGNEETASGNFWYGGNYLDYENVPQEVAKKIDRMVDGDQEGGAWERCGKFEYGGNYYGNFYITGGR